MSCTHVPSLFLSITLQFIFFKKKCPLPTLLYLTNGYFRSGHRWLWTWALSKEQCGSHHALALGLPVLCLGISGTKAAYSARGLT